MRLLLPLLLFTAALCPAQPTASPDTELAAKINRHVEAFVQGGRFQGSVLVAREGRVVLEKGYGLAQAEWGIANAPDTKFRLGSITKQFTGMAVLLLEQDGKLKTTASVCEYIAPCPERWKPITLHHLLTHTSGIPNFTSFPDYEKTMALPSPAAKTVERFRDRDLEFDPGTKFKYSNSGYVLLGVVIEKTSGASYADFVRQRIFAPLGMRDTGYDTNAAILPKRAEAYERAGKELRHAAHIDMTIPHAAGALYSTVQDLFKWDRALQEGQLLSPESRLKFFTPALDNYAYGWIVRTVPDGKLVMHGGGINGFATDIKRMPEKNLVAVALCNAPPCDPGRVTNDALAILLGGNPVAPKDRTEVDVSREVKARYTGEYELAPTFILTVTLEGDQLMTQATGQGKIPIFPESDTKFFPKVIDALITFETDEGGKATGLVLEQNGRRMPAKRR